MNTSTIIQVVMALLTGGIGVKIFDYLRSKRKDKVDEYIFLIKTYKTDLDEVKKENESLREELSRYKQKVDTEIVQLRQQIVLLESAHQDLPLPMWLKDTNGLMLALNPEYEETFLIPIGKKKEDYIGHTDFDIWPQEVAQKFTSHDAMVFRSGRKFDGIERVPDEHGNLIDWRIIKYVRYSGRTKIGIAGVAFKIINNE